MEETRKTRKRGAPPTSSVNGNGNGHHKEAPVEPPNPGGPPPEVGQNIESVRIDTHILNSAGEAYQRPVDLAYVDYLVENWDWNAFRTLLVNQRPDGTYWLVDGQHRVLALRKKFGRDLEVWTYLTHVDGPVEEARLYELVSDGHSKLSPAVLFRGRLTRREPVAVDIDRIVREEGYSLALLGPTESEFQLTIPAVLDRIYKKDGPDRLREVLAFCRDTWGGQPGFASSHVVTGVAKFFEYFSGVKAWDRNKVVEVLQDFPLPQVVKEGKVVIGEFGYHRHIALAVAMQRLFNSKAPGGKRGKLFRKGED